MDKVTRLIGQLCALCLTIIMLLGVILAPTRAEVTGASLLLLMGLVIVMTVSVRRSIAKTVEILADLD